ncbi:hypothetical protein PV325_001878 [Microctonus aethiopoides]|nr:hypothetical protein PV325_001878 [Microctonus aethiopoides]
MHVSIHVSTRKDALLLLQVVWEREHGARCWELNEGKRSSSIQEEVPKGGVAMMKEEKEEEEEVEVEDRRGELHS